MSSVARGRKHSRDTIAKIKNGILTEERQAKHKDDPLKKKGGR